MLDLSGTTTVCLACGVTDLRKSYHGLAAVIKLKFDLDPYSRCMFAFCNRRRTSIKIMQWDGSEFCLAENIRMLKDNGIVPGKLPNGYVSVDIDVTPFDNSKTKKQGVSRTYKGCDGFAPIVAYIGTEGYLVNCEFREGKQHCRSIPRNFYRKPSACAGRSQMNRS